MIRLPPRFTRTDTIFSYPTLFRSGYLEGSGGNFGMHRIQAVLNTPVSDSFKLRFGVDYNKRDGHLKNFTGIGADEFGDVDYISGRVSALWDVTDGVERSEEHTSELQSLMRISYAVFCLKKKNQK